MNLTAKTLPLTVALFSAGSLASTNQAIEEVVIQNSKAEHHQLAADLANSIATDAAQILRTVPGANVNGSGTITGIAQYRGLSGDRVSISLDGGPVYSGGPNAMDAPLSYAPTSLLSELKVTRGIASVSSAQESIGGHIEAVLDRGDFSTDNHWALSAELTSNYQSASNGTRTAVRTVTANNSHKIAGLFSRDKGNDSEFPGGQLTDTKYKRNRFDFSYGYRTADSNLLLYAGQNSTKDSGTPALAMDIRHIDTDLAGMSFDTEINNVKVLGFLSWSQVDHGMDNFSLRTPPAAADYRQTQADAEHLSYGVSAELPLAGSSLTVGADASRKDQSATVTNPNNAAFEVINFNRIDRDINGLFAEWHTEYQSLKWEVGVRHNRTRLDAGTVSANGMMGMMAMNANMLAINFNSSDRSQSFNTTGLVVKADYTLTPEWSLNAGLARKHRAPSYQEMFLWLPMQSTGGLADGRSYIGNLDLRAERGEEVTLGLNWRNKQFYFTPQIFYRRVTDYIQGTPADNVAANMISTMMGGLPALQFNNVNAELYGFDTGYGFYLSDHWHLEGAISYVQGQRRDANDYLYRIAPLNHQLAVSYQDQGWSLRAESILYSAQDKVAIYNDEENTSGYGIINLRARYNLSDNTTLSAGIENLFDKGYQDHLAGYNRVMGSDVAAGERMYGVGRNLHLGIQLYL
ncbi:TonB-dependent receptor [Porticoccaceae bacterium LTM1]|nr:TonB-dependent receptor [Porticoccaceae bacterium LTM1]